jgi:hypothetical protein
MVIKSSPAGAGVFREREKVKQENKLGVWEGTMQIHVGLSLRGKTCGEVPLHTIHTYVYVVRYSRGGGGGAQTRKYYFESMPVPAKFNFNVGTGTYFLFI